MSEILNVLIVDDEYHARKLLSEYVSKIPFLKLIGTASNVFEAMDILRKNEIDILLSDIQMPEISGLEFVRSLKRPPAIIFTTAYSEYAVESYELDVIDYLLKPIAFPRFLQAINKVTERRVKEKVTEASEENELQQSAKTVEPQIDHFVVKSGHKFYKINFSDLLYIEGQREYVTFCTVKEKIMVLASLKNLEETLPSDLFIRVHKSAIVSIRNIELVDKNRLHIAGKQIAIGSTYKDALMKLFQ